MTQKPSFNFPSCFVNPSALMVMDAFDGPDNDPRDDLEDRDWDLMDTEDALTIRKVVEKW